jgi:hypothetical protein
MHDYAPMGEQRTRILAGIRSGGFPHVAAEAFGLAGPDYERFLQGAEHPAASESVRSFAREAREAHAQARLRAEIAVFEDDPKVWLEHGPGRETPHRAGWAGAVKPCAAVGLESNALADRRTLSMLQDLADHLKKYDSDGMDRFLSERETLLHTLSKESPHACDTRR